MNTRTHPEELSDLSQAARTDLARWLKLAVSALAVAGLFALLLVLSRAPLLSALFPWTDFFRSALVVHVNLSVLVWFLAFAGLIAGLADRNLKASAWSWWLACAGTIGMALAAFDDAHPLLNNYVPVLQTPLFFIALGLLFIGVLWRVAGLLRGIARLDWRSPAVAAALSCALIVILAVVVLLWGWLTIPASVSGEGYFEYLFWGAGHTLQFAYTQLMMLAWLLLARASGVHPPFAGRAAAVWLWAGMLPLLFVLPIHALYPVYSPELRLAFTRLMQFGAGFPSLLLGPVVLYALWRAPAGQGAQRLWRACLWMSLLLFAAGGLIAMGIRGVNTIIPAHYHGSIVGVTLALMGLAYWLLPRLGRRPVSGRWAVAQPMLYGGGQLLHISGLALAGALGIQRKTAGAAQGLDTLAQKLTMGLMGLGGLLAVAGGVLFVWFMARSLWATAAPDQTASAGNSTAR